MSFHQDLDNMTRDMHDASMEVEYMLKTPVLNLIMEKKNVKFKGGKLYYFEVDTDTTEDTFQDYSNNDRLTHAQKDTTDVIKFGRKHFQGAVTLDLDEELQNALDSEDGTQLHNLAKHKVKKLNEGGRLHLRKKIFGAATDTNKEIQGLNSALVVDTTYGYKDRNKTAGTNNWWQPADNRYTAAAQATETAISIDWLQGIADPLQDLENGPNDVVVIVGNTLWLALKSEAQARSMPIKSDPNGKFKFGIEEMIIDGMRVIKDPFLQTKYNTAMGQTTGAAGDLSRRLYVLNLNDWYFMIHPKRNFMITPWFDQKNIAGGADFEMARLLVAGNIICKHPNRSGYWSNVVA